MGTEGIRGCRERTQVSRLRIDGADVRAKRQAPRQREQKRTATQEKRRCVHCGKGFHVKGIWKHQESCKIEASSSSDSDEVKLEPSRAAMKPSTSSGQSSEQAELLASLKEMFAKALQPTVVMPAMVPPHDPLALAHDRERQLHERLSIGSANAHELAKARMLCSKS